MVNLRLLKRPSKDVQVYLLQLGLKRAGENVAIDGVFGGNTESAVKNFQKDAKLLQDGIAGVNTWRMLMPYLTGYVRHTIKAGDSIFKLAAEYGTTAAAIETANPGIDVMNLKTESEITIPLAFDVVPIDIPFTYTVLEIVIDGLKNRYPKLETTKVGESVMGKTLYCLKTGEGCKEVFFNASHHANEWITTPVVLKFMEEYIKAEADNTDFYGTRVSEIWKNTALYIMPMVNPDGVDLVTGELTAGEFYENAGKIAKDYAKIPFPSGWKANIHGVDLNLQYPAGWEIAKKIKAAQGYISPAPRDYVGEYPLQAPESKAVYEFTKKKAFSLTLSYHTQGQVIFWQYMNFRPAKAREIAVEFSAVSGYAVADVPYESSFAGYKDWFIQEFLRPAYTIEAGKGASPLNLSKFVEIYNANGPLMKTALILA